MSNHELIFRPATENDLESLFSVRPAFYQPNLNNLSARKFLHAVCNTPGLDFNFGEYNGEPISSIMVYPKDTEFIFDNVDGYFYTVPPGPHPVAWLDELYVKPSMQKQGIGTQTIAWGLEHALNTGYSVVEGRTENPIPDYVVSELGLTACGEILLPDGNIGYNYAKNLVPAVSRET